MTIRTKETDVALAKQLIAGFKLHMSTISSLTVDGVSYTPAQIEAFLQELIDLRAAVDDAKSATKARPFVSTGSTASSPSPRSSRYQILRSRPVLAAASDIAYSRSSWSLA